MMFKLKHQAPSTKHFKLILFCLIALILSACSTTPTNPTIFKPGHQPLDPNLVDATVLLPYAKLEKIENHNQFFFKWISNDTLRDDARGELNKIGYVDLTTLKPWLDRQYLGSQICHWDGCDFLSYSNSESRADALMYQNAIATGYYRKKINWTNTAGMQTLGQVILFAPLIFGMHDVWAKFSEKDFKAALNQALENTDINTLYLTELNAEKQRLEKQAKIKHEQEQERVRLQQLRAQQEQQRIQREREQKRLKQQTMRNLWNAERLSPKQVGDKVCTFEDNIFGYVEQVAGNGKIQIRQRGKAINKPAGLFFGLYEDRFNFSSNSLNNPIIWADSSEWGRCEFYN